MRLAMEALEEKTARLPNVEMVAVDTALGRSTGESIQSRLYWSNVYWSNVGMLKELTARLTVEVFADEKPLTVATGGFSQLFARTGIFDHLVRELILTACAKS